MQHPDITVADFAKLILPEHVHDKIPMWAKQAKFSIKQVHEADIYPSLFHYVRKCLEEELSSVLLVSMVHTMRLDMLSLNKITKNSY